MSIRAAQCGYSLFELVMTLTLAALILTLGPAVVRQTGGGQARARRG
jgi:prepilin-type N-terminal cleavage/methylation domain-containing protein